MTLGKDIRKEIGPVLRRITARISEEKTQKTGSPVQYHNLEESVRYSDVQVMAKLLIDPVRSAALKSKKTSSSESEVAEYNEIRDRVMQDREQAQTQLTSLRKAKEEARAAESKKNKAPVSATPPSTEAPAPLPTSAPAKTAPAASPATSTPVVAKKKLTASKA
jgi:hypothetical protein